MWPDLQALVPLLAVIGLFSFLGPVLGRQSALARWLAVAVVAGVVTHYLAWRIPVTVLPADDLSAQSIWVWFLFAIEVLAMLDAGILFATLLRRTNRSPEADAHEARLRTQAPGDLPTVLVTLVKPFGHAFKVTPKGRDAAGKRYDPLTVRLCSLLIGATALGLLINSDFDSRIIDRGALIPIVAIWSAYNMLILLLVAVTAFAAPARRSEERFELDEPARLRGPFGQATARLVDLSLSGAQVALDAPPTRAIARGDWIWVRIAGVGEVASEVMRAGAQGTRLGLRFYLPTGAERDLLIAKLFTQGMDNATRNDNGWQIALGMLSRLFAPDPAAQAMPHVPPPEPPDLVLAEIRRKRRSGTVRDLVAGQADSRVA